MKILVIIVSYNFERWIDRCLGSLRQSSLRPDVVVIDNASKDRTVSIIEKDYPEVRLVRSGENLGFGKANNIGMKIAIDEGYNAVYLLNQDAWIRPDTLDVLSAISGKHPDYGVLSPVHLDASEKKMDKGFADYLMTKKVANTSENGDVVELSFVNAAHWYIPVPVIRKVGGFSPLFHLYGEDVDMVNRIRHLGYRLGYCPKAFAIHDRAERKESAKSIYRARFVYLLSEYTNINRSFPSAFAYSVLASVKWLFHFLSKACWSDASMYVKICLQLLGKTVAVVKTRNIIAVDGAHFL